MKKKILIIFIILLILIIGLVILIGGSKKENNEVNTTNNTEKNSIVEEKTNNVNDTSTEPIEGNPVEYGRDYWEEKYPGENICPFTIEENGVEYDYYWVSSFNGYDGTIKSWLNQPFNWNGWHETEEGYIVNKDETLKITDNWLENESMSSFCTVTTEKYDKNNYNSHSTEENENWPTNTIFPKPDGCKIIEVKTEDWKNYITVEWDSKEAAKKYIEIVKEVEGNTANVIGQSETDESIYYGTYGITINSLNNPQNIVLYK